MAALLDAMSEQQSYAPAPLRPEADTAAPLAAAIAHAGRQPIRGGLPPRTMRRVLEYIETHLAENISIESLAAVAGLSMFHFARTFKQSAGQTPHGYVVQCRVRRAKGMLASTDLSLSEIAVAAGFSDQSHCARRFREHVGVSPRDYRWGQR